MALNPTKSKVKACNRVLKLSDNKTALLRNKMTILSSQTLIVKLLIKHFRMIQISHNVKR